MKSELNVIVVGGGQTGTPLLNQLIQANFVKVLGIADLDLSAPGILLAQEKGLKTSNDFSHLIKSYDNKEIDIIIDVTGVPAVAENLRNIMKETDNNHTVIMHEILAVLLMSLSKGELTFTKHHKESFDYKVANK